MNKRLRAVIIIVVGLVATLYVASIVLTNYTKSHSPEDTVSFEEGKYKLEVFYNRPSKEGREIFGGLVPFGEVWRTGANEATTFTTNQDIKVKGQILREGKYTLWTVPGPQEWKVIFNSEMYPWGIKFSGETYRDSTYDVVEVRVAVERLEEVQEMFTIDFTYQEIMNMTMSWDQTKISVPIQLGE